MKTNKPMPSKRMVESLMKELSQRHYCYNDTEYVALSEEEDDLTKELLGANPRLRAIAKAKGAISERYRKEEEILIKKFKKIRHWYFASGDIAKAVKELKALVNELNT